MFIELFKEFDSNSHFYKVSSLTKGIMAGALCPKVIFQGYFGLKLLDKTATYRVVLANRN